jgi:hypothetical protein
MPMIVVLKIIVRVQVENLFDIVDENEGMKMMFISKK